jgi:alginate O-acetyltransferase complex protein AlgI
MLFNSYIFILLFLPVTLIGYYIFNKFKKYKLAKTFLLVMSIWFYAYFNITYLPIIITSIIFNFMIYKGMQKDKLNKKILLIIGIIFNIGMLIYFKYFDFFIENINVLFKTDFALKHILLPLGISFFTFQQVSFVIDSYKQEVPSYKILDYALFVTFFPQLIAGPIVSHDEIVPQFEDLQNKKLNFDNFAKGIYAFTLGLAKKVLIADMFGKIVNYGFINAGGLNTTNAILVMLAYTFQIYFDFSGYCDMATGIGLMFNIKLPMNFNSPYKSLNIIEFWKKWHITLTRFFTKYVYIPLGGSKKGTARTYANIFIIFFLSGIWHGANWTFILWGALHGIYNIITRIFKKFFEKLHPAFAWIINFTFINLTWIYFRADSISQANTLIKRILSFQFGPIDPTISTKFRLEELKTIFGIFKIDNPLFYTGFFFILALVAILSMKNTNEKLETFKPTIIRAIIIPILLVWGIVSFAGESTFLYFNF